MTPRQATVLNLIVDDYITAAAPIPSQAIARKHDLGVSSATVRNEVAHLEDSGYLTRPHTSAGSVPLDKAYRFHVESLTSIEMERIPEGVQSTIRARLSEVERDLDEWARVAATVLASLVGNMAITTFPKARESRVKHLEVVQLQDLLAMAIIVLEQARLRRQIIILRERVEPSEMEASANKVRNYLTGLTRREIEINEFELTPLEESLVDATVLSLREEERGTYSEHYLDGLRNLLNQPEFSGNERVRPLVEAFEDGTLVHAILEQTPEGNVVRVTIGQENRGDMLWPMSVVICQYGIPDQVFGAMGAIGPTRMEYSKTIAAVKFLSSAMGELVEGVSSG